MFFIIVLPIFAWGFLSAAYLDKKIKSDPHYPQNVNKKFFSHASICMFTTLLAFNSCVFVFGGLNGIVSFGLCVALSTISFSAATQALRIEAVLSFSERHYQRFNGACILLNLMLLVSFLFMITS